MSSWRLVEAEPNPPISATDAERENLKNYRGNYSSSRGRGLDNRRQGQVQGGRGGRGRGGGRGGRGRKPFGFYTLPHGDREYLIHLTLQQIEYIFSIDSLCMDTFIRSYMDVEGYVPIALICNYQNVCCYGLPYSEIKRALSQHTKFDVDLENETIRLKEAWDLWLMPNNMGGRGLPKYIKQAPQPYIEMDETLGSYFEGEGIFGDLNTSNNHSQTYESTPVDSSAHHQFTPVAIKETNTSTTSLTIPSPVEPTPAPLPVSAGGKMRWSDVLAAGISPK